MASPAAGDIFTTISGRKCSKVRRTAAASAVPTLLGTVDPAIPTPAAPGAPQISPVPGVPIPLSGASSVGTNSGTSNAASPSPPAPSVPVPAAPGPSRTATWTTAGTPVSSSQASSSALSVSQSAPSLDAKFSSLPTPFRSMKTGTLLSKTDVTGTAVFLPSATGSFSTTRFRPGESSGPTNQNGSLGDQAPPPVGAVVGGIVGGILGLAILALLLYYCLKRRRKAAQEKHRRMTEKLDGGSSWLSRAHKGFKTRLAVTTSSRYARQSDQVLNRGNSVFLETNISALPRSPAHYRSYSAPQPKLKPKQQGFTQKIPTISEWKRKLRRQRQQESISFPLVVQNPIQRAPTLPLPTHRLSPFSLDMDALAASSGAPPKREPRSPLLFFKEGLIDQQRAPLTPSRPGGLNISGPQLIAPHENPFLNPVLIRETRLQNPFLDPFSEAGGLRTPNPFINLAGLMPNGTPPNMRGQPFENSPKRALHGNPVDRSITTASSLAQVAVPSPRRARLAHHKYLSNPFFDSSSGPIDAAEDGQSQLSHKATPQTQAKDKDPLGALSPTAEPGVAKSLSIYLLPESNRTSTRSSMEVHTSTGIVTPTPPSPTGKRSPLAPPSPKRTSAYRGRLSAFPIVKQQRLSGTGAQVGRSGSQSSMASRRAKGNSDPFDLEDAGLRIRDSGSMYCTETSAAANVKQQPTILTVQGIGPWPKATVQSPTGSIAEPPTVQRYNFSKRPVPGSQSLARSTISSQLPRRPLPTTPSPRPLPSLPKSLATRTRELNPLDKSVNATNGRSTQLHSRSNAPFSANNPGAPRTPQRPFRGKDPALGSGLSPIISEAGSAGGQQETPNWIKLAESSVSGGSSSQESLPSRYRQGRAI